MPDIFGRTEDEYTLRRDLRAAGDLEAYEASRRARVPGVPRHDFNAFGAGIPAEYRALGETAQAFGYVTNNMLALSGVIDEVMYTTYRLPLYMFVNNAVPEGATSWGDRITRRVGRAQPIPADGSSVPRASVSSTIASVPLIDYGLEGAWTRAEIRGAMFGNFPLQMETIEAAITGTLDSMEVRALTGDGGGQGLVNQPTTGTGAVTLNTQPASMTIETDLNAVQIRSLINTEISSIIADTDEVFGRNVTQGMTVLLPPAQYDRLSDLYIGNDARMTLLRSLLDDNPWTNRTGNPLMIESCIELEEVGPSDVDRMVTTVRDRRVAEFPVAIEPRLIRLFEDRYSVCAPVEAKFGDCWVKRPKVIRYRDAV